MVEMNIKQDTFTQTSTGIENQREIKFQVSVDQRISLLPKLLKPRTQNILTITSQTFYLSVIECANYGCAYFSFGNRDLLGIPPFLPRKAVRKKGPRSTSTVNCWLKKKIFRLISSRCSQYLLRNSSLIPNRACGSLLRNAPRVTSTSFHFSSKRSKAPPLPLLNLFPLHLRTSDPSSPSLGISSTERETP